MFSWDILNFIDNARLVISKREPKKSGSQSAIVITPYDNFDFVACCKKNLFKIEFFMASEPS